MKKAIKGKTVGREEVKKIANLANLTVTPGQIKKFGPQLSSVLEYVSKVQKLNTQNVPEAAQVTNTENVFRADEIDNERILTQKEAVANAKRVHNGYFVVKAIFTNE